MLRSNCKEVKDKIRQYILDGIQPWYADNVPMYEEPFDTENYPVVCNKILQGMKSEGFAEDFKSFCRWTSGLCSYVDTNYYLCSAKSILMDWLEESEEEAEKYSEDDATTEINYLLWRELQAHKKGGEAA